MADKTTAGKIILVVADIEETRDGIERLLTVDGYCILSAREEQVAVAKARRQHPQVILMSLDSLHVDVSAIGRRIRRRAALSDEVPVVVFGIPTLAEGTEMEIGRNTYVVQPDNFDQLRAFLGRLLQPVPTAS